ncbi:MAG: tetratricopeptide repeat protein [Pseudomonadota bacterium]
MGQKHFTEDTRREIRDFISVLNQENYYSILSLGRDAGKEGLRRVYFSLIKRFHPDSYFREELGEYKDHLEKILLSVSKMYDVLSSPEKRERYNEYLEQQESIKNIEQETRNQVEAVKRRIEKRSDVKEGIETPVSVDAGPRLEQGTFDTTLLEGSPSKHRKWRKRRLISVLGYAPARTGIEGIPRRSRIDSVMSMAKEYERQGKPLDALRALEVALEYDPDNDDLRNRFDSISKKVIPELAGQYYKVGCSEEEFGNHEKALESYRIAVQICPGNAAYHYGMAKALFFTGRKMREAVEHVSMAIRKDPKNPDQYLLLGKICLKDGRDKEARSALRMCLMLDPDRSQAAELLRQMK